MKIKPIGDRVVIRQIEAEEKTKSGIILTSKEKEKPMIFEVLVAGDGKMSDGTEVTMIIKVGDKVIANKYSGLTVKIDEDDLTIIKQGDIQAIVQD